MRGEGNVLDAFVAKRQAQILERQVFAAERGDDWLDSARVARDRVLSGDAIVAALRAGWRVDVRGALIKGDIDLRDFKQPHDGAAQPDLKLIDCRIDGVLRMTRANLGFVDLSRSVIGEQARGAAVEGDGAKTGSLILECVRIVGRSIRLRGSRIDGELSAVRLAGPFGPEFDLDLAGARIAGPFEAAGAGEARMLEQRAGAATRAEGARCSILAPEAVIGGRANMNVGRFDRLNFQGASVSGTFWLQGASLTGELTAVGVKIGEECIIESLDAEKARAIDMSLADIGGRLMILQAKIGSTMQESVISVSDARIRGDVTFVRNDVRGVFHAEQSRLDGALQVLGSTIIAGDGKHALNAQAADIARSVWIAPSSADGVVAEREYVIDGGVSFRLARIGGDFAAQSGKLKSDGDLPALDLANVAVTGSIWLEGKLKRGRKVETEPGGEPRTPARRLRLSVVGGVVLWFAQVGGVLSFRNVRIIGGKDGMAIHGRGCRVAGGVDASWTEDNIASPKGVFDQAAAETGGNSPGRRVSRGRKGGDSAPEGIRGLTAHGAVNFLASEFSGTFHLTGAILVASDTGMRPGVALDLTSVRITRGDLRFRPREQGDTFSMGEVHGKVVLVNSEIEGELDLTGIRRLAACKPNHVTDLTSAGHVLDARGAKVDGDVILHHVEEGSSEGMTFRDKPARIVGAIVLDRADIGGSIKFGRASFRPAKGSEKAKDPRIRRGLVFGVENARIRGDFIIERASSRVGLIDLSGTQLRAFKDNGGINWGDEPEGTGHGKRFVLTQGVQLDLEGCVWERLDEPDSKDWCKCIDVWLLRQHPRSLDWFGRRRLQRFNPEPHEQAVRVLASSGHKDKARKLAIASRWHDTKSRRIFSPVILRPFGWFFGFGYDGWRASCTLFSYLLLGWVGSCALMQAGWLAAEESGSCATSVDAFHHALVSMVLALDLGNADPCGLVHSDPRQRAVPLGWGYHLPDAWTSSITTATPDVISIAHTAYGVLGSIILLVAALTFGGVLRRDQS